MSINAVLVVEDDVFQRNVLLSILRYAEHIHRAEGVGTAEEALAELRRHRYDIIFLDLGLPGMDGLDVIHALADEVYTGGIAVVSAMDNAILHSVQKVAELRGLNLLGTVGKPVSMEAIDGLVERFQSTRQNNAQEGPPEVAAAMLSDAEIEAALAENRVEAFFQPKVDLRTRKVRGYEALARIRSADNVVHGPGSFISRMEETGRIEQLTYAMIEQATAAQGLWARQGFAWKISINLSLRHQDLGEFLATLDHHVREHHIAPSDVIVEVTESAVMVDLADSIEVLTRIRMRGYGLSIDDFGTGFAGFEALHRLPFSELKIDRCFVSGVCAGGQRRTILESCLELAARMRLTTVCEGVESVEQLEALLQLGCDQVQGFYISRPVPAGEVMQVASGWEAEQCSAEPMITLG